MRRDEQFTVGESARLELNVASGSIRIGTGDTGSVRVSIEASDHADVEVTQMGDVVSVRQLSRWLTRGRAVQVGVWLPMRSDVTVDCASADVQIRGELGAVRVRTASGDIDVDTTDRIEVRSASGDVRLQACNGSASIVTASGDVTAGRVGGSLASSHASGDVRVEEAGGAIDVSTASGDVTIRRCLGDDIAIKTVSGDVNVGLPSGIRVHPEISTLSGRTTLPRPGSAADVGERRSVRLRLRTVSGDIRVERLG
jgi:Putative adhesin